MFKPGESIPVGTREDLDMAPCGCGSPACENLHAMGFTQQCHPESGLNAAYLDGKLILECRECRDIACVIQVAERGDGPLCFIELGS